MDFMINKLLDNLIDDMRPVNANINELLSRGYDHRFELAGNKLMCMPSRTIFYSMELSVDYLYRIPDIGYLYGICHRETNLKGIFMLYLADSITLN